MNLAKYREGYELFLADLPNRIQHFGEIIIVNKTANLLCHSVGNGTNGIIEALRTTNKGQYFYLANRADGGTTGCVMVLQKKELIPGFYAVNWRKNVEKTYYALVEGRFQIQGRQKVQTRHEDGMSITYFETVQNYKHKNRTLVRAFLGTGHQHQIRKHLSEKGHPIIGDYEYGSRVDSEWSMLHSYSMKFMMQGEEITAIADLPEYWWTEYSVEV